MATQVVMAVSRCHDHPSLEHERKSILVLAGIRDNQCKEWYQLDQVAMLNRFSNKSMGITDISGKTSISISKDVVHLQFCHC